MRSFVLFLISLMLCHPQVAVAQSKQNFIKVASVDINFLTKKLSEDPNALKVIVMKTKDDFKSIGDKGDKLRHLKEINPSTLSAEKRSALEKDIAALEQEVQTYFSRLPSYSGNSNESYEALYFYIQDIMKLEGISLLLEKNAAVLIALGDADITLKVWDAILKEKRRLGL